MKCKYCGKELRERQRFCDRCGRTVRHINEGTRRTSSYDSRRLETQRQTPVKKQSADSSDSFRRYDKYRREQQRRAAEQKKRKAKFRRFIVFIVLLSLCISVIGFIIAFNKTKEAGIARINAPEDNTEAPLVSQVSSYEPLGSINPMASETAEPTDTSTGSTQKPDSSSSPKPSSSPAVSAENDKYMVYKDTTSGITCPYPANFEKSDVSSTTTRITVTDGDAQMRINTDKTTTQDSAQSILKSYSSGVGVEVSQSSSDKNIYSVSFVRNGKYNHRTGIIANGRHIYYDFSCAADSAEKSEYKEIIKYVDDSLQSQVTKLNSEE